MNLPMGPLASLLAAAALLQSPPQDTERTPTPCLLAQLHLDEAAYPDSEEFDEVAMRMLDRAMAPLIRFRPSILVYSSAFRHHNQAPDDALSRRRSETVRDHLVARGLPAERIRIIESGDGWERFGNPGDNNVLVLIEYPFVRRGMAITGYTSHSFRCSTVLPGPSR